MDGEPANIAATKQALIVQLKDLCFKYMQDLDYASARSALAKLIELDKEDIDTQLLFAKLVEDGDRSYLPTEINSADFLIVGADSRVGSAIETKFLVDGRRCIGTTRRHPTPAGRIYLDLSDPPKSWRLPDHCDVTFLLAGITSLAQCEAEPELTRQVNVNRTIELARMLGARCSQVIYISTNLVFSGDVPDVDAYSALSPQCHYARQKAEVEQTLMESGMPVSIVRVTKVAETLRDLLWSWAVDLIQDRPICPFSDLVCAPCSMDDLINSLIRIGDIRKTGLFQLGGGPDIRYDEIARRLAQSLNVRQELVRPTTSIAAGVNLPAKPRYTTMQTAPPDMQHELPAVHSDVAIGMVVNDVTRTILKSSVLGKYYLKPPVMAAVGF